MTTLNENEKRVLTVLVAAGDSYLGFGYLGFAGIGARLEDDHSIKLDRKAIRRACRSLKRKGLAEFCRGLWTEDGEPAGSGYAATKEAHEANP